MTTENSSYPRCELREMESGGDDGAAWSTSTGVHALTITQAITHLPEAKPHVVAGQVHDAEDDVLMIRLEDTNLTSRPAPTPSRAPTAATIPKLTARS